MASKNARVRAHGGAATVCVLVSAMLALVVAPLASATPTWTPIRRLNPDDTASLAGAMAVAPDGTVHQLLPRAGVSYHLYATRHRPGHAWEEPALLANADPSYGDIAVDGNGTVTATWNELADGGRRVRAARRSATGGWSSPMFLSALGVDAQEPVVVAAPGGDVTVLWAQGTGIIMASTRAAAGGGWGTPVRLSQEGAQNPRAVVDDDGRIVAVWNHNAAVEWNQRSLAGSWRPFTDTGVISAPGQNSFDPVLALDAAGTVFAVWLGDTFDGYNVRAARKAIGEPWFRWPDPLSATGITSDGIALGAGPAGGAVAVWLRSNGSEDAVEGARLAGGLWGPATQLSAGGQDAEEPAVVVDKLGVATAAWSRFNESFDVIQTRRGTADGWSPMVPISSSAATGLEPVLGVDPHRNVVAAWRGAGVVRARAFDVSGPKAAMTSPTEAFSTTDPFVAWRSKDAWSAISTHQVRVADASPTSEFATSSWLAATPSDGAVYDAVPGNTYCFKARGTDAVGNQGPFSRARCVAQPLNDRALSASAGWTRADTPTAYRGTRSVTTTEGATLTSPLVNIRRIALVATRAPGAGAVKVYFDGVLRRRVVLTPTAGQDPTVAHRQQIIPIVVFEGRRAGRVTIVSDNSNPVSIEGLGVSGR